MPLQPEVVRKKDGGIRCMEVFAHPKLALLYNQIFLCKGWSVTWVQQWSDLSLQLVEGRCRRLVEIFRYTLAMRAEAWKTGDCGGEGHKLNLLVINWSWGGIDLGETKVLMLKSPIEGWATPDSHRQWREGKAHKNSEERIIVGNLCTESWIRKYAMREQ